jgi:hypothetical protein
LAYQNIIEAMRSKFESSVFGKEKDDSFQSSIAQISKGFGDIDFYPSIEEKAATLLFNSTLLKSSPSRFFIMLSSICHPTI